MSPFLIVSMLILDPWTLDNFIAIVANWIENWRLANILMLFKIMYCSPSDNSAPLSNDPQSGAGLKNNPSPTNNARSSFGPKLYSTDLTTAFNGSTCPLPRRWRCRVRHRHRCLRCFHYIRVRVRRLNREIDNYLLLPMEKIDFDSLKGHCAWMG